jgi:hypothetical protein
VWKSDSGALDESDNVESETTSKWETSDAFKRAWVQWGIGRFLYEKEIVWITEEEYMAYKYKITEFCNWKKGKPQTISSPEPAFIKSTTEQQIKDEAYICNVCWSKKVPWKTWKPYCKKCYIEWQNNNK